MVLAYSFYRIFFIYSSLDDFYFHWKINSPRQELHQDAKNSDMTYFS